MLEDFRGCDGQDLRADVCVIGAGAAGIALAVALIGSGRKVLLLESGDLDPSGQMDPLQDGDVEGLPFGGLKDGRARALGGTTRLWAGQCIRLDEIDLEARSWVPNSGWPLTLSDLGPYYARAELMLGLGAPVYDARIWSTFGIRPPQFYAGKTSPKFTIYCPQPDFRKAFGERLGQARDVQVLLNATVAKLAVAKDQRRIDAAEVRTLDGGAARVFARDFVLCGGAIENARLLLASNDHAEAGLGNETDQVGRYFQDHPNATAAVLSPEDMRAFQCQFGLLRRRGVKFWPKLALAPQVQRQQQVLNGNAYPFYDYPEGGGVTDLKALRDAFRARRLDGRLPRAFAGALRAAPPAAREALRMAVLGRAPIFPPSRAMLRVHVEQAPDRGNRVTLSGRRDPLGVPLPTVHWRLGELERRTVRAIVMTVAEEFRRLRLAETRPEAWVEHAEADLDAHVVDAYHHAGTTRMGGAPHDSVVDTDCRLHGIGNVYVAGSSVFPTCGYANPTLTIVALALRLADHLRAGAADVIGVTSTVSRTPQPVSASGLRPEV